MYLKRSIKTVAMSSGAFHSTKGFSKVRLKTDLLLKDEKKVFQLFLIQKLRMFRNSSFINVFLKYCLPVCRRILQTDPKNFVADNGFPLRISNVCQNLNAACQKL